MISILQCAIFVLSLVTAVLVIRLAIVQSRSGRDLYFLDRGKGLAPWYYQNLKWTGRFNGLMCAIMSAVFLLATPYIATDPQGGWPMAIGCFPIFCDGSLVQPALVSLVAEILTRPKHA